MNNMTNLIEGFEDFAASVAFLTSVGIPDGDAIAVLDSFLREIHEPSAALRPILDRAGVSISKITSGELTLQSAAQRIYATLTALGKSAPQVFSCVHSSTAVYALRRASTDAVKKASLAQAIADQVPQAATEYDALGNVVAVNTEKVQALAEKNKTALKEA